VVENIVDFFVRIDAMRTFDHSLRRGNHLESELDPQKSTEILFITANEGESDEI
jgi:hypothetical protein